MKHPAVPKFRISRSRKVAAAIAVVGALATQMVVAPAANAYPRPTVDLVGHGFGHGRGLSQYGSLGYALAGQDFTTILDHYYGGTSMGDGGNPGIGVRIVNGDGGDLIVTANNAFNVGGRAYAANEAARIRRIGTNSFSLDVASSCGGPWTYTNVNATGPVTASPPSSSPGNNLALMIQRCGSDGTRGYRGSLQAVDDGGTARAVNSVLLNDYLRGVVPRESPASWGDLGSGMGINALRAQAVAARSYAIAGALYPYATTCDTTSCQVYGGAYLNGADIEDSRSDNAIAQTGNDIRRSGDSSVARTEFSSSSGGYTAGGQFPAVVDDGDATPSNPNHNWGASIPVGNVESAYPSIGSLASLTVNLRNNVGDFGGRVVQMTLVGSSGSVTTTGADFRSKLGLKSDWFQVTNTPSGGVQGYWMTGPDGGVYSFGNAPFYGSAGNIKLQRPIVGMSPLPNGQGYWLVAGDGGIFSYGGSHFFGSTGNIRLNQPVVAMAPTPSGNGYWLVAADGGIFSYGDANFYGSTGNIRLNRPIVGMATTPSGHGYWLVASDGGIFAFGDAPFLGSTGNIKLNQPVVGMAAQPSGNGYFMVGADGGIFAFGNAPYVGSLPGSKISATVTGVAPTKTGSGYMVTTNNGTVYSFGDAPQFGSVPSVVPGFKGKVLGIAAQYQ